MSISIINRNTSGGLKPELIVQAPAQSTIDIIQNNIIIDTYTLGASETTHTFIVKLGTYTVQRTLEANSMSVEVIVDTVKQYTLDLKSVKFTTNFTAKESNWIEEGGTFTFNPATATYPGLYQASGSKSIGTVDESTWSVKRLIIPLLWKLEKYHAETVLYWDETNINEIGRLRVVFQDAQGNDLFQLTIGDAWSASRTVSIKYTNNITGVEQYYVKQANETPYDNVPLRFTVDYNGTTMKVGFSYNDGDFAYKTETYSFPPISRIVVYFASDGAGTYPTPMMNVRSFAIEETSAEVMGEQN